MNANVNVGVTPHFGLSYRPIDRLHLTLTAHAPQQVELGTSFTFLLATGVEQSSGVTFVLDYKPWQFGLGAAFDLLQKADQTLSVAGSVVYATWSSYIDRHGVKPTPQYEWADTLSPTLGVHYRIGQLHSFLDASFTPTPVPLQTGRTNYVDNDRISSALGTEYRDEVPDDARISGEPVAGTSGLQTNNPGWPGFSSAGWILGATLYFAVAF